MVAIVAPVITRKGLDWITIHAKYKKANRDQRV